MNPIKRITLENFQSHAKTIVEPASSGQLSVIVGASDTGKTAIIRALKWVFFNEPQGAEFMRTGASMVRVTLDYADGISVVRERTKATNRYKIIRPGTGEGGPEVFEGFGGGVPLEIQEITGIRPVKIADQELMLNLSEQLDPPFLGQKSTSSPGRAKILGKLAGTEEIDVAGAETGRDLYRRSQDEKRLEAEIKELEEKIQGYAWVESLGQRIKVLEQLVADINVTREKIIKFSTLKSKLENIKAQETEAQKIITRWINLPKAEKAMRQAELNMEKANKLTGHSEKLRGIGAEIQKEQKTLSRLLNIHAADVLISGAANSLSQAKLLLTIQARLSQITAGIRHNELILASPKIANLNKAAATVNKVAELQERWEKLFSVPAKLNGIESQREKLFKTVVFYDVRIPELQEQYIEELAAAKICPTCGQKIEKTKLKEAI